MISMLAVDDLPFMHQIVTHTFEREGSEVITVQRSRDHQRRFFNLEKHLSPSRSALN